MTILTKLIKSRLVPDLKAMDRVCEDLRSKNSHTLF